MVAQFDGGGERDGSVGIVGSGVEGRGGSVTLGAVGKELGNGGNVVGVVGLAGKGMEGNGGNVALGNGDGIWVLGNGGKVGFG